MGLLYGQIMAINRALDLWEPPSEELGYSDEEEGDEADEEDEEEGEVAESDGGDTDPTDESNLGFVISHECQSELNEYM